MKHLTNVKRNYQKYAPVSIPQKLLQMQINVSARYQKVRRYPAISP
ncbi:hypothetical protein [Ruegeria atlantica]